MTSDIATDFAGLADTTRGLPSERSARRGRRFGRGRWGAVLLFLTLGTAVMWPFRTEELSPVSLRDIIIPVIEARFAIDEGQFPVRVSPRTLEGSRYPMFQFYGNLPISAAALVYRVVNVTPYQAWKLIMLLASACGGYFAYRCAYQLTRHPPAALAAGVLFVTAPYFLCDLYQRAAYSEFTALNLLPMALYFTLRTFVSRRRPIRNIVACAVAWTMIGMSHNIAYLYGATFVGFYFVLQAVMRIRRPRALAPRITRLVIAGVLHAGLILWYVMPQLLLIDDLMMTERTEVPFITAALWTPLYVLMAGWPVQTPDPVNPPLGLQIGWPVLGGTLLAILGTAFRQCGRRRWPVLVGLLVPFVVAILMVWSPFNFWPYLPRAFKYVQFTYRLLLFAVLYGALLGGLGLSLWFPRRAGAWRGYAFWSIRSTLAALAVLVLAGLMARNYIPPDTVADPKAIQSDAETAVRIVGLEDYQISNKVAAKTSWYHRDLNLAGWQYNLLYGDLQERSNVPLPGPTSASGLLVEGVVRTQGNGVPPAEALRGARVYVLVAGRSGEAPLTPDPNGPPVSSFRIHVPLDPAQKLQPPVKVTLVVDVGGPMKEKLDRAVKLTNVRWESPAPGELDDRELRAAEDIATQVRQGRRTSYRFASTRPTLVQLPVLYYPKGLLEIRDRGRRVPPENVGNVGRFVALKLPPGAHKIDVMFAGVIWANNVSLAAWCLVLLILVVGVIRRRGRQRSGQWRHRYAAAPPMGVVLAVVAAGAVIVGVCSTSICALIVDRISHPGPRLEIVAAEASSESRPDLAVANAFDGKDHTEWSATGGGPAKLVLYPERAGRLEHITLESRGTLLLECWYTARVVCRLSGQQVFENTFSLSTADSAPVQHIDIPPTLTDPFQHSGIRSLEFT